MWTFSLCVNCKTKTKKFANFIKKISKFYDNPSFVWLRLIFEILIIHKPSLRSCQVPHKIKTGSVQSFDVYWIQTNKHRHPDRQAKYILFMWKFNIEYIHYSYKSISCKLQNQLDYSHKKALIIFIYQNLCNLMVYTFVILNFDFLILDNS